MKQAEAQVLDLHSFASELAKLEQYQRLIIALSGGMDSVSLLHLLRRSQYPRQQLLAVYVNHQLQPDALHWQSFCQQLCERYQIAFRSFPVLARAAKRQSPEDAARIARYQVFRSLVKQQQCLLTAHHRDDQIETLLLQLLRGSGVRGLSAMKPVVPFAKGFLARPLLSFSRQSIKNYALKHQLTWIEDPSNQDLGIRRNFLRHKIIPQLKQQWQGLDNSLSRVCYLQAQASELLDDLAREDLSQCQSVLEPHQLLFEPHIHLSPLLKLSGARVRNLIRYWIDRYHLPAMSSHLLEQFMRQFIHQPVSVKAQICWQQKYYLRHFRNHLFLSRINEKTTPGLSVFQLICPDNKRDSLQVAYRQGGEKYRQGKQHHSLKKWFSRQGIPWWIRPHLPLLYQQNRLGEKNLIAAGDTILDPAQLEPGTLKLLIHPLFSFNADENSNTTDSVSWP